MGALESRAVGDGRREVQGVHAVGQLLAYSETWLRWRMRYNECSRAVNCAAIDGCVVYVTDGREGVRAG